MKKLLTYILEKNRLQYSDLEKVYKTILFYFQAGHTGQIGALAVKVVTEVNRNVAENAYQERSKNLKWIQKIKLESLEKAGEIKGKQLICVDLSTLKKEIATPFLAQVRHSNSIAKSNIDPSKLNYDLTEGSIVFA